MEFVNQFVVPAPVDQAWELLTDVPRIAPCLPGATVQELPDGSFEGTVAVKVGPIKVSYSGVASFTDVDAEKRTLVLGARGKEKSGKGSVAAIVHVELTEQADSRTRVQVVTDLQVTGKVAQFGRSAMADVGERLIGQFAGNLEALLGAGPTTAMSTGTTSSSVPSAPTVASGATASGAASGAEFNALSLAAPLLKRAAPSAAALVVGLVIGRLLGGSRRRGRASVTAGAGQLPVGGYPVLAVLSGLDRMPWLSPAAPSGETTTT